MESEWGEPCDWNLLPWAFPGHGGAGKVNQGGAQQVPRAAKKLIGREYRAVSPGTLKKLEFARQ